MTRRVELYFDFGSPTSYLAWTQLPELAHAAKAELVYRPVLLGGIFRATGNSSPATIPAKAQYMFSDLARFADRYGVPMTMNPHFPINTLWLMRAATGLQLREPDRFEAFVAAAFEGMWVSEKDLGDAGIVAQVFGASGFDVPELHTLTQDPEIKERLKAETESAVSRGLFGCPTMFVGDEMFFGQDRLDFVRQALERLESE